MTLAHSQHLTPAAAAAGAGGGGGGAGARGSGSGGSGAARPSALLFTPDGRRLLCAARECVDARAAGRGGGGWRGWWVQGWCRCEAEGVRRAFGADVVWRAFGAFYLRAYEEKPKRYLRWEQP